MLPGGDESVDDARQPQRGEDGSGHVRAMTVRRPGSLVGPALRHQSGHRRQGNDGHRVR